MLLTTNWCLGMKQFVGKAACGLGLLLRAFSKASPWASLCPLRSEPEAPSLVYSMARKISVLLSLGCSEVNIAVSYWVHIFPCTYINILFLFLTVCSLHTKPNRVI